MSFDITSIMQNTYRELEEFKTKVEKVEKVELVGAIESLLDSANDLKQRLDETAEFSERDTSLKKRIMKIMKELEEMPTFTQKIGDHHIHVLSAFKRLGMSIQKAMKKGKKIGSQ